MNPGATPSPVKTLPPPIPGVQMYAFALSPEARAELSIKGTLTLDDLDLLRDHVELTIRALSKATERMRKQKERIIAQAQALLPGCKVIFEDGGPFVRFKVTKDDVEFVGQSEDRLIAFFEALSDEDLRIRLRALSGGRIK